MAPPPNTPHTILITGASSGLGAALALACAKKGRTLFLGARRIDHLETTAAACRKAGATVHLQTVDVTDRPGMAAWIEGAFRRAPLDLVIANAGVSAGTSGKGAAAESHDQIDTIFRTNVEGVFNTVLPVVPLFRTQGHGQIALISSLAGFRGMPGAPTYCASKASVRVWGEGMRALLHGENIKVSVVCPGFVKTPMTDANGFHMPFLMDPAQAASLILKGLEKNQGRISFPWPMALGSWLLGALPDGLAGRIARRTPLK